MCGQSGNVKLSFQRKCYLSLAGEQVDTTKEECPNRGRLGHQTLIRQQTGDGVTFSAHSHISFWKQAVFGWKP